MVNEMLPAYCTAGPAKEKRQVCSRMQKGECYAVASFGAGQLISKEMRSSRLSFTRIR